MQTVVIFGVPYTPEFYQTVGGAVTVIFSLFPWCTLAKGVQDLSSATVSATSPGDNGGWGAAGGGGAKLAKVTRGREGGEGRGGHHGGVLLAKVRAGGASVQYESLVCVIGHYSNCPDALT